MESKIYKLIYTYRNLLQFLVAVGFIYIGFLGEIGTSIILGFVWASAIVINRFITVFANKKK